MSFLEGLTLGLAMILPIGPQNLFVLNNSLLGGWRRGTLAALTAALCDTLLIAAGATGAAALLARLPALRIALLALGVVFLLVLGVGSLRQAGAAEPERTAGGERPEPQQAPSPLRLTLTGVGLSWGNPHAILDTVAVLGAAIAAQAPGARLPFAAGTVTASWVFFCILLIVGAAFGARLPASAQRWIRRGSGALMLVFAAVLLYEALSVRL